MVSARAAIFLMLPAALCTLAAGQDAQDEWKSKDFDLNTRLLWSLANAPLTENERDQIFGSGLL